MVAVLLSCVALPIVHAQPSPYHYAQRSSYPFGCRDVASKKEVGRYHLLIQYRFTVNMSAEEGGKEYTPDYDLMNLEIGKYFSRYYSTSADKCDSIVFNARNGKRLGDRGVDAYGWMKGGRLALYETIIRTILIKVAALSEWASGLMNMNILMKYLSFNGNTTLLKNGRFLDTLVSELKQVSAVVATRSGSLPTSLPAGDHGSFTVCRD